MARVAITTWLLSILVAGCGAKSEGKETADGLSGSTLPDGGASQQDSAGSGAQSGYAPDAIPGGGGSGAAGGVGATGGTGATGSSGTTGDTNEGDNTAPGAADAATPPPQETPDGDAAEGEPPGTSGSGGSSDPGPGVPDAGSDAAQEELDGHSHAPDAATDHRPDGGHGEMPTPEFTGEMWAICDINRRDDDCSADLTCYRPTATGGRIAGFCTEPCDSTQDCPDPPDGVTAEVLCNDDDVCELDCSATEESEVTCPEAMVCRRRAIGPGSGLEGGSRICVYVSASDSE